jgi:hypothetical protein
MAASKTIAGAELSARDVEARRIRILDKGAIGRLKMQVLKRLRASPVSWRMGYSLFRLLHDGYRRRVGGHLRAQ